MASKQTYPCFACRKAGYEVQVYLDGKDAEGRTKYLNEDGTKHVHKTQQQQKQQQEQEQDNNPLAPVSDESVERGIDAFNLMTSLIKEVEEVKAEIKHVREVLSNQERLFNQMLVWVQQMKKQSQQQQK